MNYIRWASIGTLIAFLVLSGWLANGWRLEAREAAKLRIERDNAIERERKVDLMRADLQSKLNKKEVTVEKQYVEIVRNIPVYVDRSTCSISADGVRSLNRIRGVPQSSGKSPGEVDAHRTIARKDNDL